MKKTAILTLLLSLSIVWSCDESKLDLVNPNELSPETFFETSNQLRDATNAAYANLQTLGLYTRIYFFANDLMSQESTGLGSLAGDLRQFIDHSWNASHGPIAQMWTTLYQGIHKANFVIENASRVPEVAITDELRNHFEGEARFLRAYYYFELVSRWGEVPLLTNVATVPEGVPVSSTEEVYAAILADLQFGVDNMLSVGDLPADRLGAATRGAALALKGKVHLFREEWDMARQMFEAVDQEGYVLVDEFFDNFTEESENNGESIFEVQFTTEFGASGSWGAAGSGVAETTFRSQEYSFTGWRNVIPSETIMDEFEDDDPRFAFTFYSEGDLFNNGQDTVQSGVNVADERPNWRKYQRHYKEFPPCCESGINFRVIRYADVLLMHAEALNELGDQAGAVALLNQVRARPSVDMPLYGTAEMDGRGFPVGTQDEVFEAIQHERISELTGEQKRYMDLQRWGLTSTVVPNYQAGVHERWPIPQVEIDANAELTQNPGY